MDTTVTTVILNNHYLLQNLRSRRPYKRTVCAPFPFRLAISRRRSFRRRRRPFLPNSRVVRFPTHFLKAHKLLINFFNDSGRLYRR